MTCLKQGASKVSFTACHLGKLLLTFISPQVIWTSPQNFFMSRIDFRALSQKLHLPFGQVENKIHSPDSKIH